MFRFLLSVKLVFVLMLLLVFSAYADAGCGGAGRGGRGGRLLNRGHGGLFQRGGGCGQAQGHGGACGTMQSAPRGNCANGSCATK